MDSGTPRSLFTAMEGNDDEIIFCDIMENNFLVDGRCEGSISLNLTVYGTLNYIIYTIPTSLNINQFRLSSIFILYTSHALRSMLLLMLIFIGLVNCIPVLLCKQGLNNGLCAY